eukprot:974456-Rhodomonas_salina.1
MIFESGKWSRILPAGNRPVGRRSASYLHAPPLRSLVCPSEALFCSCTNDLEGPGLQRADPLGACDSGHVVAYDNENSECQPLPSQGSSMQREASMLGPLHALSMAPMASGDVVCGVCSMDDGLARDGLVGPDAQRQLGSRPLDQHLVMCRRDRIRPPCTAPAVAAMRLLLASWLDWVFESRCVQRAHALAIRRPA